MSRGSGSITDDPSLVPSSPGQSLPTPQIDLPTLSPALTEILPPESGDLLHHRGRTRDQPRTIPGIIPLAVVPGRLVEPVGGLVYPENRPDALLGHEQVHALDDPHRPPGDVPVLVLLCHHLPKQLVEPFPLP